MKSTTKQTPGAGLRERKKVATRQALAWAAMQLSVERGLQNVRVADITDAVDVSRRTFTNYFTGKEEAIASLNADRAARAVEVVQDRPAGEPLADSLAEAFADQLQAAVRVDRERLYLIRMMVSSSPMLAGEYLKTLDEAEEPLAQVIAQRTGADPQRDLQPFLLSAAVTAAVRAATGHWLENDGTDLLPDLIRQAIRQVAGPANPR